MSKIPKKLYVVSVASGLGFLNAYEPGLKSFEKKKVTQHDWAYGGAFGYGAREAYEKNPGEWWLKGHKWVWNKEDSNVRVEYDEPMDVKCQPRVWDNDPLTGFKILKSVSRYSTSNKLWRIMDPRGVEFEITTAVLEEIILNSTIINGEIQDKCVWVTNKNLQVFKE